MQHYTVLYSQEGYFLILEREKKNQLSLKKEWNKNSTLDKKTTILNEIISHNFPVTIQTETEIPFKSCLRGLAESLDKKLVFQFSPQDLPESQVTLRKMIINNTEFEVLLSLLDTFQNYYSLFIELNTSDLRKIQSHLPTSVLWHVEKEKKRVCQWKENQNIDASLTIIKHLANNILGKNILYDTRI